MGYVELMETRLIGLVGGLGPAATIHYYGSLLAECMRRGVTARIIINQATVDVVLDAAARGDRPALAAHLAGRMVELQGANAKLLAIAAITPHMCMPELVPQISLPMIDAITVTDAEIRRRGITRVALMGTRATVASRLFGRLGTAVVDPTPGQVARVHDLYVSIVKLGRVEPDVADELRQLAVAYVAELDVQAVVLAGTELALAPAGTWEGLQVIDCAALHIDAIAAAASAV
jgi:aspartate racemase